MGRRAAPAQVLRRGDDMGDDGRTDLHCNHVLLHQIAESHAGVESLADDVDKLILDLDLDPHIGIAVEKPLQDRLQRERVSRTLNVQAQKAARVVGLPSELCGSRGEIRNGRQRTFEVSHPDLGQTDTARRPIEQSERAHAGMITGENLIIDGGDTIQ